ncbi:MAG: DNA-3-methyladenine glycosylase [Cyanobacteria bacterium P01_F01_bin.4]
MTVTNRNVTCCKTQGKTVIRPEWCDRNALQVAPDLIGCTLIRQLTSGETLRGLIVETEAYLPDDPACHAYRGQTASNAAMFGPPGYSYVYLIYGMYHCLNVVTDTAGTGSAVLLRALALDRLPSTLEAKYARQPARVAAGPGKLCRTLDIDRRFDRQPFVQLQGLWLEHRHPEFDTALQTGRQRLVQTNRIGLSKAVDKPWRWYLDGHPAVSKKGVPL